MSPFNMIYDLNKKYQYNLGGFTLFTFSNNFFWFLESMGLQSYFEFLFI
jgi:hypothetical protein